MAPHSTQGRRSALPRTQEALVPWLAAALFIASLCLLIALADVQPSKQGLAGMILGLGTSLAVAGLVAARSHRNAAEMDRRERERPSHDELPGVGADFGRADDPGASTYIAGMERWTQAMLELTDYASARPTAVEAGVAGELGSASEDTRALRE
jgi:hypothetical protein